MGNEQTITVEATGTASAPPDIARLRLFTFAEDPEPGDALTTCSLLAERVLAALKAAGIASSDLETTSIELNQHQHQRRDGEETVSSYRASTGLDAMVRPPEEVGRMVARCGRGGGHGRPDPRGHLRCRRPRPVGISCEARRRRSRHEGSP